MILIDDIPLFKYCQYKNYSTFLQTTQQLKEKIQSLNENFEIYFLSDIAIIYNPSYYSEVKTSDAVQAYSRLMFTKSNREMAVCDKAFAEALSTAEVSALEDLTV